MSSAKRTPRYVDAIRPFEVVEQRMSADVIRLRPEPLGPALPPITEQWPRVRAVPVARRPWQLLLVPPTPGATTRTFNVARWQARLVLGAIVALLLVAIAGVSTLVVAVRTPEVFTSEETELLRARLLVVEDSLALALAELEPTPDSAATAVANATGAATAAAPAARRATKLLTPSLKAPARRSDRAVAAAPSVGIEGLPVIGAIASRFSRTRRHPLLHVIRPHLGVDVAAPRGTQITAPAPGRVTFVGRKFGFGLVVEMEHAPGVLTRYAHCGSTLVSVGTRVERGTPIATVGTSGLSTGPHLHYEVLVNGRQVDPLRYKLPQPSAGPATATTSATASTTMAPPATSAAGVPAPVSPPSTPAAAAQSSAPISAPQ
jgi:murein DD-endopeptidase MepM/ murein hydrolase activator NlpD